jgi:iron complex transport system permease protein
MSALTSPKGLLARRGFGQRAVMFALVHAVLIALGLLVGSEGLLGIGTDLRATLAGDRDVQSIIASIRLPRTLGAWLVGALLGLAGAVAQGLFRNPLADPYLLGTASGASLGVVLVLSAGVSVGGWWASLGMAGAAFLGALAAMALTWILSAGAQHTGRLLLAGVVVGVMLGAVGDLVVTLSPQVLRARQGFLLGQTGLVDASACWLLAAGWVFCWLMTRRYARALDALTLGESVASSLGLDVARARSWLVAGMAAATGVAVAQAGLVAFVGLLAPHLARRLWGGLHRQQLWASSVMGGLLLLGADVASRLLIAPQELPVGILTSVVGGAYLLSLLHQRRGMS